MCAANGSIFTILAISFERYYAICKPLKAGYKCTRLRATIIICLIWLLSTLLTSPILIMAKSSETIYIDGSLVYNCILETDSYWPKMYVFGSMFSFFCLPLVVLMLVYWLISRRLIRENIAMSTTTSLTASESNENTQSTTCQTINPTRHTHLTNGRQHHSNQSSTKKRLNRNNLFANNSFTTFFARTRQHSSKQQLAPALKQNSNGSDYRFTLNGLNHSQSTTYIEPPLSSGTNEIHNCKQYQKAQTKKLAAKAISLDNHFVINESHSPDISCNGHCLNDTNECKIPPPQSNQVNILIDESKHCVGGHWYMFFVNWIGSYLLKRKTSSKNVNHLSACCSEGSDEGISDVHCNVSNSIIRHHSPLGGIMARLHSICDTDRMRSDANQTVAVDQQTVNGSSHTNEHDKDERGSEVPFLQSSPSPSPSTIRGIARMDDEELSGSHMRKRRLFLESKKKRQSSTTGCGSFASTRQSLKFNWAKRFSVSTSSSTSTQTNTTTLHSESSVSHSDQNSNALSYQQVGPRPIIHCHSNMVPQVSSPDISPETIKQPRSAGHQRKNARLNIIDHETDDQEILPRKYVTQNHGTAQNLVAMNDVNENVSSSTYTSSSSSSNSNNSSKSPTPDFVLSSPGGNIENDPYKVKTNLAEQNFPQKRDGILNINKSIVPMKSEVEFNSSISRNQYAELDGSGNYTSGTKGDSTVHLKSPCSLSLSPTFVVTNTCDILLSSDDLISDSKTQDNKNNNNNNNNINNNNSNCTAVNDRNNSSEKGLTVPETDVEDRYKTEDLSEIKIQEIKSRRIKLLGYSLDRHNLRHKSKNESAHNNHHHQYHFNLKRSCKRSGKQIVATHLNSSNNKTQLSELLVVQDLSKKQQMDSRRQVVVMLAFVVTCFFLLFFPYRVFTIWLILSTEAQVQSLGMETYYNLTYLCRILIYLHSAINPIAYNLISTKFRRAFKSILLCRGSASRRHFTTDYRITNKPTNVTQGKSLKQTTM